MSNNIKTNTENNTMCKQKPKTYINISKARKIECRICHDSIVFQNYSRHISIKHPGEDSSNLSIAGQTSILSFHTPTTKQRICLSTEEIHDEAAEPMPSGSSLPLQPDNIDSPLNEELTTASGSIDVKLDKILETVLNLGSRMDNLSLKECSKVTNLPTIASEMKPDDM